MKFLNALNVYDDSFKKRAPTLKSSYEHAIICTYYAQAHPWKPDDGIEILLENLRHLRNSSNS